MIKEINHIVFRNEDEALRVNAWFVNCRWMKKGQHQTVENPLPRCAKCPFLQDCKPWESLRNYSRADFEDYGNDAQFVNVMEALNGK
jgi:hypothetical protein